LSVPSELRRLFTQQRDKPLQAGSNTNGSATSTFKAVAGDSANSTAAATTLTLRSGTGPDVNFPVAIGETKQQVVGNYPRR